MLSTYYGSAALALAALALASPAPSQPKVTGTEGIMTSTPIGGANAVATAPPQLVEALPAPPKYMTIIVVNSHGDAISTSHAQAANGPSAVSGNVGVGTMSKGQTAAFAVPTGWSGNVAINVANYKITGDDSLIEASFINQASAGNVAVADIDVSYVNGFSVAIVCQCDATKAYVSGCNKNLFRLNTCPNNDGQNACDNPLRASTSATAPTAFFAPCKGVAYTFPNDNSANSYGQCQSSVFRCCVGNACPPNPNQPSGPTT